MPHLEHMSGRPQKEDGNHKITDRYQVSPPDWRVPEGLRWGQKTGLGDALESVLKTVSKSVLSPGVRAEVSLSVSSQSPTAVDLAQ